MTNYKNYEEMIVKASKHAVNAVFLMKSKRGSELPSKWNNWDNIQNTVTIEDRTRKIKKADTIVFRTASGYVDNISRDDLEQIASLAICEELACAEPTKQFEYDELFEIAFIAIRRKVGQVQYNTHGRYIAKLKSSKAIQAELEKANQTDLVNAIINKTDKAVTIAKKAGIDIYDRTTGPAYNQARMIENKDYENLQTRIYQDEKEQYIIDHMKPELAKLYRIYKYGFEPCNSSKKEITANYIREKMHYGNSISRQTINNRLNEMKSSYRKFAKEYDVITGYGDNYSRGLAKRDASNDSVSYLAYLAKKARKAEKANKPKAIRIQTNYYQLNTKYIAEQKKANVKYVDTCKPVLNVAESAEYNASTFKPTKRYVAPQITSIADVREWKPSQTNKSSKETIPIKTLISALKSKKTSESSKKDIADYLIKHYPKEMVNDEVGKIKSKKVSENILAIVVSTHTEK